MTKKLQTQQAVLSPANADRRVSTAHKTMPLAKAVWANVFILFLLLGFWRTGGAQTVFNNPVGINTTPAAGTWLHTNGVVRMQGLPASTLFSDFLSINTATGELFTRTVSTVPSGTLFGESLYWDNFSTSWQPNSFLRNTPTGVGVNTAPAPGIDFHVNGQVRFENLNTSTGIQQYLTWQPSGDLAWQTGIAPLPGGNFGETLFWNGAEWQNTDFLTTVPGVGIGIDLPPGGSPLSKLHLDENAGFGNYALWTNPAAPTGARIGQQTGTGVFQIIQDEPANIELWTGGSQRITLDPNGFVGIGTVSPTVELHVDGQVRFENLNLTPGVQQYLTWQPTGDIGWQNGIMPQAGTTLGETLYWDGTNWSISPSLYSSTAFSPNFVGVNTPAQLGVHGQYQSVPGGWFNHGMPGVAAAPVFSVTGGDIECSQNIFAGQEVYFSSDRRLKTNIRELSDWKNIFNIQAYSYNYIGRENQGLSYGFIAQDVQKIFPELTATWRGGGAVNYIGFIPFLAQGLKEHEERLNAIETPNEAVEELKVENGKFAQRFEALETENQDLKNRNEVLENRLADLEQKFNAICNLPCIQNNPAPNGNGGGTGSGFGQTGTLGEPPALEQSQPNPFSETTVIRYFLPEGAVNAKIEVRNVENKVVGSFSLSGTGHGNITLSAGTLAAGNYFYSLIINNSIIDTKKMVLLN